MQGFPHYNTQTSVGFIDGTQLTAETTVGLSPTYGTLPVGVTNINNIPAHMSAAHPTGPATHAWQHHNHHSLPQTCGMSPQFPTQPPPAHQSSPPGQQHQASRGEEMRGKEEKTSPGIGEEGEEDPGPQLKFPWMKTTKSHAHQWKAGWAGKIQHALVMRYG